MIILHLKHSNVNDVMSRQKKTLYSATGDYDQTVHKKPYNNNNNNNNNSNLIYKAPLGRNFRGAGGNRLRTDVYAIVKR